MTRRQLFRDNIDDFTESTIEVYSHNDNKIPNNSENTSLGIYIYIFYFLNYIFMTISFSGPNFYNYTYTAVINYNIS